jgi:hypothetical protein
MAYFPSHIFKRFQNPILKTIPSRQTQTGNRGVSDHKISEQIDHLNRWQKLFIFTGKE